LNFYSSVLQDKVLLHYRDGAISPEIILNYR